MEEQLLALAEYFLVLAMVVGATEFIKRLRDQDYWAAGIIGVAALIGGLCGVFGVQGIDVPTGIVVGLAGSGLVTLSGKIGGR